MNANDRWNSTTTDPLGLSDLEAIEPGYDGWTRIESSLRSQVAAQRSWRRTGGWLAVAASLVLIVSISLRNNEDTATFKSSPASNTNAGASNPTARDTDNIAALISLSQEMEDQVKQLRQGTSSMPAESVIYVAELEDLIAQVDNELSFTPDSIDLWGQRVNLLLDLAQIYQQQWQIDYGRMAAL
jgi:hypothetical protein